MQYMILTLLIGGIGALIGIKLKIPVGAMIGAMVAVLIYNVFTQHAYMPEMGRKIAQIAAGALLGSRIKRKDIYDLKKVLMPTVILIFGMIILNFSFGFLISRISNLDLATALFATAPGGLSDMALIADDLGADSPKVALLQLLRVIVILSVFPTLFKHICFFTPNKKIKETKNRTSDQGSNGLNSEQPLVQADIKTDEDRESSNTEEIQQETSNEYEIGKHKGVNLFFTLCIASLGGMIGITFNIPAGAMIISMVAVVVFNLSCKKAYFPGSLRIITQAATGALIGSRMTRTDLLGLDDIIIPAIVMIFGMLLLTLIIGYAIHKLCKFDLVTALLASTPGGLQEISIIAEDFGADAPKVAVLHLFRLVTVISLFPILLRYVCMHFV